MKYCLLNAVCEAEYLENGDFSVFHRKLCIGFVAFYRVDASSMHAFICIFERRDGPCSASNIVIRMKRGFEH